MAYLHAGCVEQSVLSEVLVIKKMVKRNFLSVLNVVLVALDAFIKISNLQRAHKEMKSRKVSRTFARFVISGTEFPPNISHVSSRHTVVLRSYKSLIRMREIDNTLQNLNFETSVRSILISFTKKEWNFCSQKIFCTFQRSLMLTRQRKIRKLPIASFL